MHLRIFPLECQSETSSCQHFCTSSSTETPFSSLCDHRKHHTAQLLQAHGACNTHSLACNTIGKNTALVRASPTAETLRHALNRHRQGSPSSHTNTIQLCCAAISTAFRSVKTFTISSSTSPCHRSMYICLTFEELVPESLN